MSKKRRSVDAVVIGASAGAVQAFLTILPFIPKDCRVPIISVIHIPPDRESHLAEVFTGSDRICVKEVEDKEELRPGTLFLAPPDYHVLVEKDGRLSLSKDEPVLFSRPSIDVLFESAADVFEDRLLGIVLTGWNEDGARGLQAVCGAGGIGIVQRPETAVAPVMPQAAIDICPEAFVMELSDIGSYVAAFCSGGSR